MSKTDEINVNTGLEIAVIGMAGRFPGAKNIDEFWGNLINGVETITFYSAKELKTAGINQELANNPNYVKSRGAFSNKEYFDASFFGYTPIEAEVTDPQVRIFHECCWHALEDAGYNPFYYSRLIGLYAGASSAFEWEALCSLSGKASKLGAFATMLSKRDYLCSKTSYKLNLKGPTVFVQTACSTSLVAIHLACQGLLSGECDMALAGGVTIIPQQTVGYLYQEGLILSPDGHCRVFDARAAGTIAGEGAGVVVLKRLEEATSHRDFIYAVIKGSAINNDGDRKVGFTAPSIKGQAEALRAAYQVADVDPASISYIETHGTGTTMGDPVEIDALKKVFNVNKKKSCGIGSVKSNMGHLDSAAGVTGFLKTVLALYHRLIPPSLHFETPNPGIDFENSPFYVVTEPTEWRNGKYPLRAGVSSFGIGGTNAHVVLEECSGAQGVGPKAKSEKSRPQLLLLSARTQTALDRMSQNLGGYLDRNPGINLADAAYTLQVGRKIFKYRRMLVSSNADEASAALLSGNSRKVRTFAGKDEDRPVIFMFSGLGTQYVNMGLDLYQKESFFKEEMDRCFEILKPLTKFDLKKILYPSSVTPGSPEAKKTPAENPGKLHQIEIAQLAVFILEYTLARLLLKWGIKPYAMIGYSFGEYTAACVSGIFSLEEALKLITARGRLIAEIPAGAMLSVPLGEKELTPLLNRELSLAINNGPSCIVAGSIAAIDSFEKQMKEKKILCMRLKASHAIHSHMMEPILEKFKYITEQFTLKKPQIPFISNVTGKWLTFEEAGDPVYWSKHLRKTVRFAEGINILSQKENAVFIEIGPGRDLSTLILRHLENKPRQSIINLIKQPENQEPDDYFLLNKLGKLWLYGVKPDWNCFTDREKRYRVPLPGYSFEKQRFWIESNLLRTRESMSAGYSSLPRQKDLSTCFYIPYWKPEALPRLYSTKGVNQYCWLIFTDESAFSSRLIKQLQEEGEDVIEVKAGTDFEKANDLNYTVNPRQDSDYQRLLSALGTANRIPAKILHLWGISDNIISPLEVQHLERVLDFGFYSLFHLIRGLEVQDFFPGNTFQIKVITNHLHKLPGEDTFCPGKAAILSLVKSVPHEFPNIRCCSIDIALPGPGTWQEKRLREQLLAELKQENPWPMIAFRGNDRFIHAYEPVPILEAGVAVTGLKENKVYFITGGLEGLGYNMAEYLAQKRPTKLVFIENPQTLENNGTNQVIENTTPQNKNQTTGNITKINLEEETDFFTIEEEKIKQQLGIRGVEEYQGLEKTIAELCTSYILDYFRIKNICTEIGNTYGFEDLKTRLKILPKFTVFYEFFVGVLKKDKIIEVRGDQIEFIKDVNNPAQLLTEAQKEYPEFNGTINLLGYCANHYSKALSGEIEAIGVLYPEGIHIETRDDYRNPLEHRQTDIYISLLKEFILRILHLSPLKRTFRILEIGGGQGIFTRVIAPLLKDKDVEYYFTDLGNYFVLNAKRTAEKQGFTFMRFGTFDISKDPIKQGFEAHCFDMVLGLDVVSATRCLDESIGNLKKMLVPEGILALIEVINPRRWDHMIYGLAEGWWYFEDYDVRRETAFISLEQWEKVFKHQGLKEIASFPKDKLKRTQTYCGLIIGTSDEALMEETSSAEFHDRKKQATAEGNDKIKQLESIGAEVLVIPADIANREQLRGAVEQTQKWYGPINGIIHNPGQGMVERQENIRKLTIEEITVLLSPLIESTLELAILSSDMVLDFFVLCSSSHPAGAALDKVVSDAAAHFFDTFAQYKLSGDTTSFVSLNWNALEETAAAKDFLPDSRIFDSILEYSFPQVVITTENLADSHGYSYERQELSLQEPVELSSQEAPTYQRSELSCQYAPPRDKTEKALARIWQNFLNIGKVGIDDDFFELGADSLVFITIASQVHKVLNVEVPIAEFFSRPTIKGIAEYIANTEEKTFFSIESVERQDYYPLSSAQNRLYFIHFLDPESTAYNVVTMMILEGKINRERLEETFSKLIARHDSLRTYFVILEETPVQRIKETIAFEIEYYHIPGEGNHINEGKATPGAYSTKDIVKRFIRPFDLSKTPLFRVALVEERENRCILMVDIHHIVTDGVSEGILQRDFMLFYEGKELPQLKIQYKDYAWWKYFHKDQEILKKQEEYWLKEFKGELPVLNLPIDFARPAIQSFAGQEISFTLSAAQVKGLYGIARSEGTTIFMVLLVVFKIFLSKLSGQEDIVVGTPIAGRKHADLEQIIGMFANTLALRNQPAGEKTCRQFLRELRENSLKVFENQDYQFEELVEKIEVQRDLSRNPLFDIMFVFQTLPEAPKETSTGEKKDMKIMPYAYEVQTSRFDLTMTVFEVGERLFFKFEYCTDLFKKDTIQRMIGNFNRLVLRMIENFEIKISALQIISEEEKEQILYEFNNTWAEYLENITIHEMFELQAEKFPCNTSVTGDSSVGHNSYLSYRELDKQANQLASILREKGIRCEGIVVVMMERSVEMIIAIMGILKTGGIYFPIDPHYPEERIDFMLRDSNAKFLLASSSVEEGPQVGGVDVETLVIKEGYAFSNSSPHLPCSSTCSENAAYVIFTSGSTGKPKGVVICHGSVINRLNWMQKAYPLTSRDVILQKTPIIFDVSIWELFWWSFQGASVYMLAPGEEKMPAALLNVIEKNNITTMHFVPSMLNMFLEYHEESGGEIEFTALRQVFCSGETLSVHHVERFKKLLVQRYKPKLINLYGPTEATVDVSYFDCSNLENPGSMTSIPIGRPIDNIYLYVLSKEYYLQPIGVSGELYIGGDGLARGYLNRQELTAEKFLCHISTPPFSLSPIYRTGDLSRWLDDGNIEFLGRIDFQVKIRGFRIELGEIESRLLSHQQIRQAVVLGKEDISGEALQLCAYILPYEGNKGMINVPSIREYLAGELPDYMIPSYFMEVESIPLTPNGKIDRKRLETYGKKLQTDVVYEGPRDELERQIDILWKKILSIEENSIHDNFFQLGGDSFKIMILNNHLYRLLKERVKIFALFENPTIARLSSYLRKFYPQAASKLEIPLDIVGKDTGEIAPQSNYLDIPLAEEKEFYELSPAQKRLYIIWQMDPNSTTYHMQYVVNVAGDLNITKVDTTFKQLIIRQEALRSSFHLIKGSGYQKIHPPLEADMQVEYENLKENNKEEAGEHRTLIKQKVKQFIQPFNLTRAPLIHIKIVNLTAEKHIIMIDMHHIVSDGVSLNILINDFITLYKGKSLPTLRIRYRDFSEWQNNSLGISRLKKQETFWLNKFKGDIPQLNIPLDFLRPVVRSFDGDSIFWVISKGLLAKIRELNNQLGMTLFITLLTAYNILLHKYSGQTDIIIGSPISGRRYADLENVIGVFINMLPHRNQPTSKKSFLEFLHEVKENALEAYENQDYQFDELVNRLGVQGKTHRNPIFDVGLVLQNTGDNFIKDDMLDINEYTSENNVSRFDMLLSVTETPATINIVLEYSTCLFKRSSMERFLKHYEEILHQVVEKKDIKIEDITVSSYIQEAVSRERNIGFEF